MSLDADVIAIGGLAVRGKRTVVAGRCHGRLARPGMPVRIVTLVQPASAANE